MSSSLADLRKNYSLGSLDVTDVDPDPLRQFDRWFAQALDAQLPEPNAMTLATVDAHGRPSARIRSEFANTLLIQLGSQAIN